jgi:hypothetical protein
MRFLAFYLEPDLQGYLEFMDLAVDNSAALFDDFKPIHLANGLRSFLDGRARGFSEALWGSTDELNEFVSVRQAMSPAEIPQLGGG